MRYLLHLTDEKVWSAAPTEIAPASLETEGFVHASPDEATALAVANHVLPGTNEQQVALVIDTTLLPAEVRWEAPSPAPPPGVGPQALFPHIYGPVPRSAVVAVRYLRRDTSGAFVAME
ncbi:uncharacterized protein (DUF952 family) [Haloactinospora alba]|uniref:Uncharacterized protein (DUF952 family) n=1 Tax=Haloactinospora alba TaxID=405555 RepID=A0A543NJ76_9ACTN|nr:DUF952 domain-containing protein [Haloactinospora alba]TQN31810.1 uncharacterized protein (DUF952 family) [Haloactinospora alba]